MTKNSVFMLLGAPMVRATLAGRKDQTRRRFKKPVQFGPGGISWGSVSNASEKDFTALAEPLCPYGQKGTLIKVKESAWMWCHKKQDGLTATGRKKWRFVPVGQHVVYAADHPARPRHRVDADPTHEWRLKVGRFLPGWAIRIFLEVTGVRAERVQSIDSLDAINEGLIKLGIEGAQWHWEPHAKEGFTAPWCAYKALWESINGEQSWRENEFVWVVNFKRLAQFPCPEAETTSNQGALV